MTARSAITACLDLALRYVRCAVVALCFIGVVQLRKKIENEVIILDYKSFVDVDFEKCTMVYKGGQPPTLVNNNLNECVWHFEGDARNTLMFLRSLSADPGSREFVLEELLGIAK